MADEDLIKEIMERAQSEEGQRMADETFARLKRDGFTIEERKKLKEALDTIAYEIQILSDNL